MQFFSLNSPQPLGYYTKDPYIYNNDILQLSAWNLEPRCKGYYYTWRHDLSANFGLVTTFSQDLEDWDSCLEWDGCSVGVEMGQSLVLIIEKVHLRNWPWLEREDLIKSHYY